MFFKHFLKKEFQFIFHKEWLLRFVYAIYYIEGKR